MWPRTTTGVRYLPFGKLFHHGIQQLHAEGPPQVPKVPKEDDPCPPLLSLCVNLLQDLKTRAWGCSRYN